MAENNLFHLAQAVSLHHSQPSTPLPIRRSDDLHSTLLARKNACIVCSICFTCSGYYGVNCHCTEIQPRRGKNLPEGGLDSRAKKLLRSDKEDYEFTVKWLEEYTHQVYRDRNNRIIGLNEMTEVSLCKAHSSTLYRAKKKYQRHHQAPPSPADSNGTIMDDNKFLLPQPITAGGLAAKVRELSFRPSQPPHDVFESPDFSMMTTSSSTKRKRTSPPIIVNSSASTPLLYQSNNQLPPLHYNNVIETVSLKSSPSINSDTIYYIRNLAITDTFTFRDLLSEVDIAGTPPPGKRITISDGQKIFPLNQPIRSVIRCPHNSHIEFYLGLSEKASINWNNYK